MVVVCWLKIDNFWLKLNYFSSTYPRLDFGMMLQSTMREFNWIDMSKNLMWALQTILSWSLGWKGSTRNAQINADYPYFDCIQINPAYLRGIFPKTFDYTHTSGFERNNVELDGDHSQKVLFCFEHLPTLVRISQNVRSDFNGSFSFFGAGLFFLLTANQHNCCCANFLSAESFFAEPSILFTNGRLIIFEQS